MTVLDDHRTSCPFTHDAFIYDSDHGYVATLAPLIEDAHARGDEVLAVVPQHNAHLLRGALPRDPPTEFVDATTWYEHPIATIAAYDAVLRKLPAGSRAFVVGEVRFGSTASDWSAWTRYEAALNHVLDHHHARVVCPYDARALPASVVADARRTHPYLVTANDAVRSAHYVDPADLFRTLPPIITLPVSPADLDEVVDGNLHIVRHAFTRLALAAGVAAPRVEDLSVAVNEVLTNAMVHGGGSARFRVWSDAHDGLTCAVDDDGPGVADPLLGYTRPAEPSPGGYGTWLARRLFDHSEFLPSASGGLTVVLRARVENPAPEPSSREG